MHGYIYITTNLINGKIYIGQRKGRYNEKYYGSGKLINRAIKKYGIENFENRIIEFTLNQKDANVKEKYWIAKYNCNAANNWGYNVAEGGSNGDVKKYMTEDKIREYRENLSKACKGENNGFYGKTFSKETLEHLSKARRAENLSLKARKNISAAASKSLKGNSNASKVAKVIYKDNEYVFKSRIEAVKHFIKEENINISGFFNKKQEDFPKKYKLLFKFAGYKL